MDRLMPLVPAMTFCLLVYVVILFHTKWAAEQNKDRFNSIAWVKAHQKMIFWKFGLPQIVLSAPCVEELIFRAPLIYCFSSMTRTAWISVALSSVVFGILHWSGDFVSTNVVITQKTTSDQTDDLKQEVEKVEGENKKAVLFSKMFRVCLSTLLGAWLGYLGIAYQSLWVSVGAHALWNLIMPALLPLLLLLIWIILQWTVVLPCVWICVKWTELRDRQRSGLWKFP